LIENVNHVIEAASSRAAVSVVDLDFKTLRWETAGRSFVAANLFELRQHVHAAIRTGAAHDIDLEFEISKAVVPE
jgi:hypothetical protein